MEYLDRSECLDKPELLDRPECLVRAECPEKSECLDSVYLLVKMQYISFGELGLGGGCIWIIDLSYSLRFFTIKYVRSGTQA